MAMVSFQFPSFWVSFQGTPSVFPGTPFVRCYTGRMEAFKACSFGLGTLPCALWGPQILLEQPGERRRSRGDDE